MHKYDIGQRVFQPTHFFSLHTKPSYIICIAEYEVVDHVSYEVNKKKPPYLARYIGGKGYNMETKQFVDFQVNKKGSLEYLNTEELKPTFDEAFDAIKKTKMFKLHSK